METFKLKYTQLQSRIFRLLCIFSGSKLNQSEISKLLKVSSTGIAKSLVLLEKDSLIKVNRDSKMNLTQIELNRDNRSALLKKKIENLSILYESELPDFLEESFPGTTIILFGSYFRGDDTIKSDIDLAIIGGKLKDLDFKLFEKKLNRKITLNFYSSFKDIRVELKENLCNGYVLAGGITFDAN
jgi:predicted nucleotidyltransferase